MAERRDLEVLGIAPEAHHIGFRLCVDLARGLEARVAREDQLAPARGKAPAAAALPRLDHDRVALGRARYGEGPARAVVLALMIEAPHLVGVGEALRCLVHDQRVVGPRVPMAVHDLHELVGAVIARIVLDRLLEPHVARLHVVHGGHHVPGGAPARHQIECLEQPGDVVGVIVGGRVCGADAEPLGRHGDRHQAGDRVHLHAADTVLDRFREAPAMELRHAQPVVEEGELELASLQHAADARVIVGGEKVAHGVGMAPGAREVRAVLRLQKPDQDHLAHDASPVSPSPQLRGEGTTTSAACRAAGSGPPGPGPRPDRPGSRARRGPG